MKKVTTVLVQKSGSNEYVNLPKLVKDMFDISKGDTLELYIDTKTEEITLKKVK